MSKSYDLNKLGTKQLTTNGGWLHSGRDVNYDITNESAPTADLLLRQKFLNENISPSVLGRYGTPDSDMRPKEDQTFLTPIDEELAKRGVLPGMWGMLFNKLKHGGE
jgi:hypothetical protein